MSGRWRMVFLLALALPLLVLALQVALLGPLRPRLAGQSSLRVLDRSGMTLADVRDGSLELASPVQLGALSPHVVPALLAAEDARFYRHPGVDPLALLRAAARALVSGRIVSGGSTISQQLGRTLFVRPRTLVGKWQELVYALRLEAELDKDEILEAYLTRVHFGPRVRGLAAASSHFFDKPASALSLAEAAALVAVIQAPSRLDPERHPERLARRRDWVLRRMRELCSADPDAVARALRAPLDLRRGHVLPGAHHFVRALLQGKLGAPPSGPRIASTLEGGLQNEIESLVRSSGARFAERRASAAAVLVLDGSSSVRAYVGSPDHLASAALGQNDGVLALRQPGSTLKPFVYALGMLDLGLSAASVLPDLEQGFASLAGHYVPHNHDRRFHGPVRLGQALASSLNVPAVALAERLGPERVVGFLRELGFAHLDRPASFYGPAIALGVGEVLLVELATAYATLGRGGAHLPARFLESEPVGVPRRVLPANIALQVLAILADPRERAASFGRDGPLELDVPVAVKTGTSKGNRDNWVVGTTGELTVAVWVGNFDGSPMLPASAASGAAPLFRQVMEAALRHAPAAPERRPPALPAARAEPLDVCALSGLVAGPACPHHLPLEATPQQTPRQTCDWHRYDASLRGSAARDTIEVLPARYAAWSQGSGRATPGGARGAGPAFERSSPAKAAPPAQPAILFPRPGQRFALDGRVSTEQQELLLAALPSTAVPAETGLAFEMDGVRVCVSSAPFQCVWRLRRGQHQLIVREGPAASVPVVFDVR